MPAVEAEVILTLESALAQADADAASINLNCMVAEFVEDEAEVGDEAIDDEASDEADGEDESDE